MPTKNVQHNQEKGKIDDNGAASALTTQEEKKATWTARLISWITR